MLTRQCSRWNITTVRVIYAKPKDTVRYDSLILRRDRAPFDPS